MQALPGAPQTTPRGEFWAFILALTHNRGPPLCYADCLGLVSGFLVANKSSSVEVRHVGSHATAAVVVERRARLPEVPGNNMADRFAHMSADTRYRPQEPSTRTAGGPIATRHAAVAAFLQFFLQFLGAPGRGGKLVATAVRVFLRCGFWLCEVPPTAPRTTSTRGLYETCALRQAPLFAYAA